MEEQKTTSRESLHRPSKGAHRGIGTLGRDHDAPVRATRSVLYVRHRHP
jgi:hypothetical protein